MKNRPKLLVLRKNLLVLRQQCWVLHPKGLVLRQKGLVLRQNAGLEAVPGTCGKCVQNTVKHVKKSHPGGFQEASWRPPGSPSRRGFRNVQKHVKYEKNAPASCDDGPTPRPEKKPGLARGNRKRKDEEPDANKSSTCLSGSSHVLKIQREKENRKVEDNSVG